jgi:hypothetical protein
MQTQQVSDWRLHDFGVLVCFGGCCMALLLQDVLLPVFEQQPPAGLAIARTGIAAIFISLIKGTFDSNNIQAGKINSQRIMLK